MSFCMFYMPDVHMVCNAFLEVPLMGKFISNALQHGRDKLYIELYFHQKNGIFIAYVAGVGKSCLLLQFTDKRFQPVHDLTIGELFF